MSFRSTLDIRSDHARNLVPARPERMPTRGYSREGRKQAKRSGNGELFTSRLFYDNLISAKVVHIWMCMRDVIRRGRED